jgi:hypothetical protein
MPNRVYTDITKLRVEVNRLIDQGRVRIHIHANKSHPELTEIEKVAIVRYGTRTRPDSRRKPSEGVYVCWATRPRVGLCRGVFCVEETLGGDMVLVITAFPE